MTFWVPLSGPAAAADLRYLASVVDYGLTPTVVTPSSEHASYPALNVTDYQHPQRPWKPTGVGQETLVLNFGSLITLGAIHLGWFSPDTCSQFTLQAHATNVWTAPTVDLTVLIASAYHRIARRYGYTLVLHPGVAGIQYLRLVVPAHTGNPVAIGQLVGMKYATTALLANRPGLEFGFQRATLENAFEGAGSEKLAFGPRQILLNYPWEYAHNVRDAEAEETGAVEGTLMVDPAEPMLLVPDITWLRHWGSIFRRTAGPLMAASPAGAGAQLTLSFEEVIK